MGTITVDHNAGLPVTLGVAVATQMRAFVHHNHPVAQTGKVPGNHGAAKPGPNHAECPSHLGLFPSCPSGSMRGHFTVLLARCHGAGAKNGKK
ncbi:hypothetical protein AA19596_1043 [Acetobacter fabarum DSM 19596]|nr:hypothetical protein AA19596_1043 [Acetobacter fabarum DSM 19596]